jgi:hypothetical protein
MKYKTSYEWVAELLDEHGDIIEPMFGDTLKEVQLYAAQSDEHADDIAFALVQNIGEDINGLQDRGYAYIGDDGYLPEFFDNGESVPKKYLIRK